MSVCVFVWGRGRDGITSLFSLEGEMSESGSFVLSVPMILLFN